MGGFYRYPGAKPFQTNESHIFYGREKDVEELYQMIRLEPSLVLHSKSGMGKSSLINAGLIPKVLELEEYVPFSIRFHAYAEEKGDTPLSITSEIIAQDSELLNKILPEGEQSLWYNLKSQQLQLSAEQGILLIFDQFEELFTYPDEAILAFAKQLSEALYTILPQRYRDQRKKAFEKDQNYLSPEELNLLDQPVKLQVLMAIRSDRMNLLTKLKAYFPTILFADFELLPLNKEQAEEAILSPAYRKNGFVTPVFDYEDNAIEYLLNYLNKDGKEPIESFQLQILCEYIEREVVATQGKTKIEITDIDNPAEVLENYYQHKINAIVDDEEQLAARKFIEEGLIFEEEERRLSMYEGQVHKSYNINPALLKQLLDTHLIRSEPSLRGGYTYELSHDTLVAPVLKAKVKRLEEERIQREEEQRQLREQELKSLKEEAEVERERAKKEQKLRETAQKNEKKARQRTLVAAIISVLALLLAIFAGGQYQTAISAKKQVELQQKETEKLNALLEEKSQEYQQAANSILELQNQLAGMLDASTQEKLDVTLGELKTLNKKYGISSVPNLPTEMGERGKKTKVSITLLDEMISDNFSFKVNGKPLEFKGAEGQILTDLPTVMQEGVSIKVSAANTGNSSSTKTFDYNGEGGVAIAADKMNVFYIGVDNPITVTAVGVSPDDLTVSISGGGGIVEKYGPVNYVVQVSKREECNINVSSADLNASRVFRVKRIPDPVARLGRKSGGAINSGEFKAQNGVLAVIDYFDFDAKCEIQGFKLVYAARRQDIVEVTNSGGRYNTKAERLVQKAKPGDTYYYDNVKAKCPGDKVGRRINTMVFKIK